MHGKVSSLHANGCGLFQGLPHEFPVTRYHSLVVQEETLPSSLKVDARTDEGAVMSLRHDRLPLFGVQFHPEAARTQYGHELISNFIDVCVRLKTGSPFDATRDAQWMAQAADCAAKTVCDAQRMAQAADCVTRAVCDLCLTMVFSSGLVFSKPSRLSKEYRFFSASILSAWRHRLSVWAYRYRGMSW